MQKKFAKYITAGKGWHGGNGGERGRGGGEGEGERGRGGGQGIKRAKTTFLTNERGRLAESKESTAKIKYLSYCILYVYASNSL